MSGAHSRLTIVWMILVGATCLTFSAVELTQAGTVAILATMTLATGKTLAVLFGFMAGGRLPMASRVAVTCWSLACGILIAALAIAAR